MNLENFLIVGAIVFSIGLYGALTKRNAVAVLMCLELMFNGVNITAVAFSRYTLSFAVASKDYVEAVLTGQIFAVFIITVAAAEVALGLAIVIAVYRSRETVLVTDINRLRK